MPELIIYLIKANIALCLFYLAYRLGLRRLTFYTLNRFFLISGIVFSSLFPLVDVNGFFSRNEALAQQVITYVPDLNAWQAAPADAFSPWALLEWVFWAGVGVMFLRLMVQLASLLLLHRKTAPGTMLRHNVRLMGKPMNPFSFFRNIYINPSLHTDKELRAILDHEAVHVKEWHSADVMLGELNNVFYWFNPGAWLMKTAIRENLEFLTDRSILRSGMDPKAYQYSLIQVNTSQYAAGVANNFNFSHLKNRIRMMNKRRSSRLHIYRYAVLACLVCGVLLSLNFTKPGAVVNNVVTDMRTAITGSGAAVNEMVTGVVTEVRTAINGPQRDTTPAKKELLEIKVVKDTVKKVMNTTIIERRADGKRDTVYVTSSGADVNLKDQNIVIIGRDTGVAVFSGKPVRLTGKAAGVTMTGHPGKVSEVTVTGKPAKADAVQVTGYGAKTVTEKASAGTVQGRHMGVRTRPNGISLRGVAGENKPLIVLDGEIYEADMSNIKPDNIESISVLKDNSATALYGNAGTNGVILITTKTGRRGADANEPVVVEGKPLVLKLNTTTVTADSVRTVVGKPAPEGHGAESVSAVYPNPTNGLVNVSFYVPKEGNGFMEVQDMKGKRVYYKSLQGFSGTYRGSIDLKSQPAGTYILNISLPGSTRLTSKIVKQ
ncbi:M56 family metallopeptidase [Chitinophaga alhagiae]|uniref:M56 family metallopeptidase n=1 Tax=Chitinophaga alhagiae TaxID=2203219 RepID=UPI000E5C3D56|nr:M56 family metallopeptidase [Chitinophaga alhagiae]